MDDIGVTVKVGETHIHHGDTEARRKPKSIVEKSLFTIPLFSGDKSRLRKSMSYPFYPKTIKGFSVPLCLCVSVVSSSRFHRQLYLSPDNLHDLCMSLGRRPAGIYQHPSLRLPSRNRQIGVVYSTEESTALLLEAVLVVLAAAVLRGI